MSSMSRNEWIQIIGIIAVVLSLIFVGLQMRQTQKIAIATLYQMRSDSNQTIGGRMVDNEKARQVAVQVRREGMQSMAPEDFLLHQVNCESILGHFENSHHLYTLEFLSDEQWAADRRQIAEIIDGLCAAVWTEQTRAALRASFVAEVDDIIQNGSE